MANFNLNIIEALDYEAIFDRKVKQYQKLQPKFTPHEGDAVTMVLQAGAYDELLLRAQVNERFRQTLLNFATRDNLDVIVYPHVTRLKGAHPTALYRFVLSATATAEVVIPQGLRLSDANNRYQALLLEDVITKAGAQSAQGLVELQAFVPTSTVKTEIIQTPLPYLAQIKSLEDFKGGAARETDAHLRARYIDSLHQYSKAGSKESYSFYAKTADVRIQSVAVDSNSAGTVQVYLDAALVDKAMINRVQVALNSDKVRPLSDQVSVQSAVYIEARIEATVWVFDDLRASAIEQAQKQNLPRKLGFGENLTRSRLIAALQIEGVYKVELTAPAHEIKAAAHEIVCLKTVNLTFKEAVDV